MVYTGGSGSGSGWMRAAVPLALENVAYLGRVCDLGRQGNLFLNGFPGRIRISLSLEPTPSTLNQRKFELSNAGTSTFQS
jgi:hypothetical protein